MRARKALGRTMPANGSLPEIPVLDVGDDWPVETLRADPARVHDLLDAGGGRVPEFAVELADAISRRWLARRHPDRLREIDRIAALIGRPGAYFLNVSYEWGCTSSAAPSPDSGAPVLTRVLDWPDRGLGRHVIAARIHSPLGRWLALTWPGYTGVLQAVAPGRFAAALNQAPMETPVGLYLLDWLVNRVRVWRRPPSSTAAHLLRRVFESAADFATAKKMLADTPIALPAIYILAGVASDEWCVIERMPDASHVIDGPAAAAANAWQTPLWSGRPRGEANGRRRDLLGAAQPSLDPGLPWLQPPVLNPLTRLAFAAEAASGRFVAQGFEIDGPATMVLEGTA